MEALKIDISINEKNKLSFGEKLAYGGGNLANCLVFGMISSFLMYFYTDIYKISTVAAGTLFLVARILDAVIDFSMGFVVDRTKTRWGKFRPFIMFGCVPLCAFAILCFTVPNFGENGKIVYAYTTYLFLMVFYSIVSIPYTAMTASLTQDPIERISVSTFPQFFGMIGFLIVGAGTVPLAKIFGGDNQAKGYQFTMIFYCIVALILYAIMTSKAKERVVVENKDEISLKKAIPIIFKNKYLLLLCGYFILLGAAYTIRNSVQIYYYLYVLKREDLIPIAGLAGLLPVVAAVPFVPIFAKKMGKRNALILGTIITIFSYVGQYLVGFDNITMIMIFTAIGGFGTGLWIGFVWGMLPDTVEYAQWKFGVRTEGVIYSTFTFAQKVSQGIAGYVAGVLLLVVGYIPNVVQSAETLKGISFIYNLLLALISAGGLIFIFLYDLNQKKYNEILEELKKRECQK